MEAQLSIARQQLNQRQQELNEVRSRREQAGRSFDLVQQELTVTEPLLASGAVSEVDLLRLRRDVSRLRGERDQASSQILRIQSAINEANGKIQEVELTFRNQLRNELSDTMNKLGSLSEGSRALEDRVKHAEIRSPVRGTVKRLLVSTVGGVVQPGKEVVEIVPLDDALILEAKITPKDIAFLRPGQDAVVKFTAYDFAIYGGLDAVVEQISADSVTDDKGNAFYIVRVRTLKSSLGENLPIIPGMVAEVDILTGKKTVLSYLIKPVIRAKANALTER
jgi:adhesin transport system membrane fusion protein